MKSTILIICTMLALATAPAFAAEVATEHEHGPDGTTLQLDAGRKWQTDAPLRQNMGRIRQTMATALQAIHENRLGDAKYTELARQVQSAVNDIVAQCKLPPAADAQLHIIVGELLTGAGQMDGKSADHGRRDGAVTVIGALEKYGKYFDDSGFRPLEH